MKLLDCTLRDAGYYSNWHYSDSDIQQYCEIINNLKIDIIEIGYRNPPSEAFRGSLYYCPSVVLKKFDQILDKSVEKYLMIDFKCVTNHDENIKRIESVKNYIDGIRIAVDADQTKGLNNFIKSLTELDLKVSINLMYGHKYLSGDLSFDDIKNIIDMKNIEILSIVDSYGCLLPDDVVMLIKKTSEYFPDTLLGYHGHNNLNLALSNSIAAIESGVQVVDSTLGGLGRGAGNLRTEDSILALNHYHKKMCDSTIKGLCSSHELMNKFKKIYIWGPEIPYAIAAMKKIPQQVVMDLMNLKRLSYLEVIDTYINRLPKPSAKAQKKKVEIEYEKRSCMVVAGHDEILLTQDIIDYLLKSQNFKNIILCGKHAVELYNDLNVEKILILPGAEADLFEKQDNQTVFQLQPYSKINKYNSTDTKRTLNNPLEIAAEYILKNNINTVFLYGFSGDNTQSLTNETENEFALLKENNIQIISLTPTSYNIDKYSLYSEMV